jgi:hypothetical protein
MAQTLFEQGKALMAEKRFTEACPKFEESERLDPAGGTLLNLANCYEGSGKTATAWAWFKEAVTAARREGRTDREEFATKRIKSLEGRLSRLTVNVNAEADVPGLVVTRDGTTLGKAAWGTAMPVDPGPHTVAARATGSAPWERVVVVGPDGDTKELSVPKPIAGAAPPLAPIAPPQGDVSPPPEPEAQSGGGTRRTVGFVVAGVGVVGLGIGTAFGIAAISKRKASDKECPQEACSSEGVSLNNEAKSNALASDIAFGAGVVGLAVGTLLVLTGGHKSPSTGHVGFALGPAGASVRGRW